ncbi:MAG TPA: tetratricopeptide repeat protein, partial [Polyangiaceae bacterium]
DDSLITSAKELALQANFRGTDDPPPLQRARIPARSDSVPEGEMYDPFAEPDPFQIAPSPRIPVVEGTPQSDVTTSVGADGPLLHQPSLRAFDPDTETGVQLKGAIHSPSRREYDPNEETSILSKAAVRAKLVEPPDDEGESPTHFRARGEALVPQKQWQSWEDEQPAPERVAPAMRTAFAARASWLEQEARSADDRTARARALLAASELRALIGETEAAEILAREAAATAPTMAMAARQARALAPAPREPASFAEALDAEGRQSPTPSARLHDLLLAADVLRLAGDFPGAAKRWDQATRLAPDDPRAPLARAADRLARGDTEHGSLRLPTATGLAPLAEAVARALKIRGVVRPDVTTDEPLANDALRRAREALDVGQLGVAAAAIAEVARIPELREAASWLAGSLAAVASEGAAESVDSFRTVAKNPAARRALAARAIELGAGEVVEEATARGEGFSAADRAVLAFLSGVPQASSDEDLDVLGDADELRPLAAALAALGAPKRRADRVAGTTRSRDTVRLARLVGAGAPAEGIEAALAPFDGEHDGETRAVALEMAARASRFGDVSDAIAGWSDDDGEGARDRSLAAALVAERAGDGARATAAYTSARAFDPANEAALRALASLDPRTDVGAELRSLGDARGEGVGAALAWLEAVARGGGDIEETVRNGLLEAAHRADPSLAIAAFLAERSARRAGDVDAVLRWIRERRAAMAGAMDPVLGALDDVVEALLVADRDPALATERLAAAHRARPADVALRELYERVAITPPDDRAMWRERRAQEATSKAVKGRLLLEATLEHERAGDSASARRTAAAALSEGNADGSNGLARLALERAEIESGSAARLADSLLALARSTDDPRERREAYERLADLDATGRDDAASALLWHRTILEEQPDYAPSLRYVEHALISDGRIDELAPVSAAIARALVAAGDTSAEAGAHAQLAARLRMHGATGEWEPTREMVELAASLPEPSLWALRSVVAHARAHDDDFALERANLTLAERASRPMEVSALVLRAGEAALRADDPDKARALLERAATEDPGDVVAWGQLADARRRAGDPRGAAEACESLGRTSAVREHRLLAWYDAGRLWLDEVRDEERGLAALEQAGSIDLSHGDLFARLSVLYTKRGARGELAALLERRLESATDEDDRVNLEIDRAHALIAVGEESSARRSLEAALETAPDHVDALSLYADLCARLEDWDAAEQAWVRLARLVADPEAQRRVYERLGELYAEHSKNLARAEVALKEVLKRAPDDVPTLERLVKVYRGSDPQKALETAQLLLKLADDPVERKKRLVEIASIHETNTHELRKAEQALEAARREFPTDVGVLRALAEFYQRQRQMPAVNILLDRASADARRSLSAGRFSPALFEMLQTVHELRGKRDGARVASAALAALQGSPASVPGAAGRAGDLKLDELLAPEALGAGLRALLSRAGDALDAASALDLKALHAQPLPPGVAQSRIASIASSMGLPPVQVLVSPQLGRTCIPSSSAPPSVVVGEPLVAAIVEPAAAFVVTRALKLLQAHASALVRTPPAELAILVSAWLQTLSPSWTPQGIAPAALADAKRRVSTGLPRQLDPEVATIALEVAGTLAPHLTTLGASTIGWADRVALLAVGDPNAALDGIAWSLGMAEGAPRDPDRRAQWVLHTAEVRELLVFAVSDPFAEARTRAGIAA